MGRQQLTASERRVAELAADGHSNPEIAQILFVTRKTVETHLGSVYRKLGITRRARLAQALTDQA
jgi:DNA-binding CsgD family transcriptional regulator